MMSSNGKASYFRRSFYLDGEFNGGFDNDMVEVFDGLAEQIFQKHQLFNAERIPPKMETETGEPNAPLLKETFSILLPA